MVRVPSTAHVNTVSSTLLRVNCRDPQAVDKIVLALSSLLSDHEEDYQNSSRVILCIGSDRSTGDALGPLVGAHLSKQRLPRTTIWGTLADPIHALNLNSHLRKIESGEDHPLIIAVDASLGKPGSIGLIEVGRGPLYPGAGVNKNLPPVGNIYLSGIVNLGGFMEQMVLQSTRLYHVFEIATVIAQSLQRTLTKIR